MKKIHIKYVKAANMWCKTYWEANKQKQEWTIKRPI